MRWIDMAWMLGSALLFAACGRPSDLRWELTQDRFPSEQASHGDAKWWVFRVVCGLTGDPLPGTKVELIRERSAWTAIPSRPEVQTFSDEDGFVRFQNHGASSVSWARVSNGGYATQCIRAWANEKVVDMLPGQSVDFLIQDQLGLGVPSATVVFLNSVRDAPEVASCTSDAHGRCKLSDIELRCPIRDVIVMADGYLPQHYSMERFLGYGVERIVLRRTPSVQGRILGKSGVPLSGAVVSHDLYAGRVSTTSDYGGRFSLPRCSGDNVIRVEYEGYEHLHRICRWSPDIVVYHLGSSGDAGHNAKVSDAGVGSSMSASVEFSCASSDTPCDDEAVVSVFNSGGKEIVCVPLQGGRASCELEPGAYEALCSGVGRSSEVRRIVVVAGAGNRFELRMEESVDKFVLGPTSDNPSDLRYELRTVASTRVVTRQVLTGTPIGIPRVPFVVVVGVEGGRDLSAHILGDLPVDVGGVRRVGLSERTHRIAIAEAGKDCQRCALGLLDVSSSLMDMRDVMASNLWRGAIVVEPGMHWLGMKCDDPEDRLIVPIVVAPESGMNVINLESVRHCKVTVNINEGYELSNRVAWFRPGFLSTNNVGVDCAVSSGGELELLRCAAGDRIVIEGQFDASGSSVYLPVRAKLKGVGPWTLDAIGYDLIIEASAECGADVWCTIGSTCFPIRGRATIRRVPNDVHKIFLAAEGSQSACLNTMGLPGAVRIVLPAR